MASEHFNIQQFSLDPKIDWENKINYAVFRYMIPNPKASKRESILAVEYWEAHMRIVLDDTYILFYTSESATTNSIVFSATDIHEHFGQWFNMKVCLFYDDDKADIQCELTVNNTPYLCNFAESHITESDTWSYSQHSLPAVQYLNYRRFVKENDTAMQMAETDDDITAFAITYEKNNMFTCAPVNFNAYRNGQAILTGNPNVYPALSFIERVLKHEFVIMEPGKFKSFFARTDADFYKEFDEEEAECAALEAAQRNYAEYHKANADASISGKAELFTVVSLHQGNTVAKLEYLGTRTKFADKPLVITCLSLVASIVLDKSMALSNPNALLPFFLNTDSDFYATLPDYRLKDEADLEEGAEDNTDAPNEEDIDEAIAYHTSHFDDSLEDTPPYVWRIYQYTAAGADIEVWIGDGWAKLYVDAVKVDEGSSDSGCLTLMTGIKSRRLYAVVDKFDYDNLQAHVSVRYDGLRVTNVCMTSEAELYENLHI